MDVCTCTLSFFQCVYNVNVLSSLSRHTLYKESLKSFVSSYTISHLWVACVQGQALHSTSLRLSQVLERKETKAKRERDLKEKRKNEMKKRKKQKEQEEEDEVYVLWFESRSPCFLLLESEMKSEWGKMRQEKLSPSGFFPLLSSRPVSSSLFLLRDKFYSRSSQETRYT